MYMLGRKENLDVLNQELMPNLIIQKSQLYRFNNMGHFQNITVWGALGH